MLLYGVGGMLLSGLFSVGPTKEMTTAAAKIHGTGAVVGFMALLFVPLLLGINAGMQKDIAGLLVSVTAFALAFITFVLFVLADKPKFSGTAATKKGLWQRFTLLFMYLPVMYFCVLAIA